MSSQETNKYDIDECEHYDMYDYYDKYDYDDFSINHNVKSSNNKKKSKNTLYSGKHVRNYTKRYNK